jgi:hypothetical protein
MYELYSWAMCPWQTTDGDDRAALRHLAEEHDLPRPADAPRV